LHAFFSGHNPGLVSMVKATMKRWWTWGWVGVAGAVVLLALLGSAVAWRLHRLPAAQAQGLMRSLSAEHGAMWASVWGPLPAGADGDVTYGSRGWSLWPRPHIHLRDVRWAVPTEVSADGQLHIERLSLGLAWRSLWTDTPELHDVRVQGLAGGSQHPDWGLRGEWQVLDAWLGPADADGSRPLSWALDASLRALRPAVPAPAIDPAAPWLAGRWQGQARWQPAHAGPPAYWRDVDLRFVGQVAGHPVPQAHLTLKRWAHDGEQQRLAWDDLVLKAQLGEAAQAAQIELRAPALDLGPDSASGQGLQGSWQTAAPLSLTWQMASAAPRGRYAAVTWPQWRVVPSGRDGTRAGGQLQADLGWLPDRRSLRWDALVGDVSVQPRGEAERQWSVRGQLELGVRSTSWQLEGQAHGGAPDAVLWDGPFATDGEWRRWPLVPGAAPAQGRLRVASLWPDRWDNASRSAIGPAWGSRLGAWPGEWQLHVGQLGWRGLRLAGAEAQIDHRDGVVRLAALSARLWDGALSATGEWRLSDGRWRLVAQSRDADLALLRQTLDQRPGGAPAQRLPDAASGRWNGSLTLSGRHDDVREWQGQWSLDARAGHWRGLDLRTARLAAEAAPRAPGPDERTDWRRLQAAGSVAGGVAHLDRFQLLNPGWRMAADGTIDLQDGALALTWSDLVGSRKRGPVMNLNGPWRAPSTRSP
jgi:hypothetical protein